MRLIFKESAAQQIRKLEQPVRIRILEKLQFYLTQSNPLKYAEPLKDSRLGGWRFRIGDYRVLFDVDRDKIIILKVGHRKEIYK